MLFPHERNSVHISAARQGFFSWIFSKLFVIIVIVGGLWWSIDFFQGEFDFDLGARIKDLSNYLKGLGV